VLNESMMARSIWLRPIATLSICREGRRRISPKTNFAAGYIALAVAVGDFNCGGKLDLAVAI